MYKDYYWLNPDSRKFLERGYLKPGQTGEQRVREIAETAEKILGISGFADKFEGYMSKGFISLSSPVWSNFGTERGHPISCFGSYINDSMDSILDTVAEIGSMSKFGGGTSAYFGAIRPRGSEISNNGKSNGSFSFLKLYETLTETVSQGSTRRGMMAGYIDIDHPDITEWLDIHTEGNPIQQIYYGVNVGTKWLKEMQDGDQQKRKIWAKVLQRRAETGIPYLFFTDNVNNQKPKVYKDKNLKIHHSNMCIVGSDRVASTDGYLTAEELHQLDKELTLFNGSKLVRSSKMKLREKDADVYTVTFDNGMQQTVTAEHRMAVKSGKGYKPVYLKDCHVGDLVAVQTTPGVFGPIHKPEEAFLLGLYHGDGTQTNNYIRIDVWEKIMELEPEIKRAFDNICERDRYAERAEFRDGTPSLNGVKRRYFRTKILKQVYGFEKGAIPDWVWAGDAETQWQYIRGLLLTDGGVTLSKDTLQLALSNTNFEFLKNVQIILANLGVPTNLCELHPAGEKLLPNGKGGKSLYNCRQSWRLICNSKAKALLIEQHTGFLTNRGVQLENRQYRDNTKKYRQIVSIEYKGKEDVYCPTILDVQPDEDSFVTNGLITFNCSEIALPNDDQNSFVCCLASLNVLHFDTWKHTDVVQTLATFLDAVLSDFIQKAKPLKHFARAVKFAEEHRAIGIGVLGWHSYLQENMIPFESQQAKDKNIEIFKFIDEKSLEASRALAKRFGEPKMLEGYGERFTCRTSVAPTKSSSFILGQVSPSIEPYKSNYYVKDTAKVKTVFKNPFLEKLLQQKGRTEQEVWDSIALRNGSVQHLDFLTEHEKEVFKTFEELSQLDIIEQASDRQKFIDQAQSLNLTFSTKTPVKVVNMLTLKAHDLGVKTLYYQFSANAAQEFSRCSSCEA